MLSVAVLLCLLSTGLSASWKKVVEQDVKEEKINLRGFRVPHFHDTARKLTVPPRPSNFTMLGFSWSNCGSQSDPILIKQLALSPDPINVPGTLQASADVVIAKTEPVVSSVQVVMKKKVLGMFIEIPCLDNVGSCTYENACDLLAKLDCPPDLVKYGVTCHCPFLQNEYNIPSAEIKIPSLPLPSIIENGEFQVQATLLNGSERLGCYQFDFSLHKND